MKMFNSYVNNPLGTLPYLYNMVVVGICKHVLGTLPYLCNMIEVGICKHVLSTTMPF